MPNSSSSRPRISFRTWRPASLPPGGLDGSEKRVELGSIKPSGRGSDAGRQVLKEIRGRLELLLGIGVDYLSLNRRRHALGRRVAAHPAFDQIGSGLMGMLYVLDEPSIGLHPKDDVKMIARSSACATSATQ